MTKLRVREVRPTTSLTRNRSAQTFARLAVAPRPAPTYRRSFHEEAGTPIAAAVKSAPLGNPISISRGASRAAACEPERPPLPRRGDTAGSARDGQQSKRRVARHPPFGEGNSNCRQLLGVWVSGVPSESVRVFQQNTPICCCLCVQALQRQRLAVI